ncbi:hypothetical protein BH23THE1_BH23THE1_12260 [soil metagenome]
MIEECYFTRVHQNSVFIFNLILEAISNVQIWFEFSIKILIFLFIYINFRVLKGIYWFDIISFTFYLMVVYDNIFAFVLKIFIN